MAKKTAAPKPWQRERPGAYRSSDSRFSIEQGDPGRWFLVDDEAHDEFGLPRTLGPFDSLEDAKEAADRAREAPPAESPLAERIAEAAKRPAAPSKPKARRRAADPGPDAAARPEPPPPPPPPPSWLDELAPDEAARARRSIAALERLGIEEAEETVKRDVESLEPAVADAILRRFVAARAVEPWKDRKLDRLEKESPGLGEAMAGARAAGLSADQLRTLAREIASLAVADALDAVSEFERDPGVDGTLPGWELVERPARAGSGEPRRMHLPAKRR